MQMKLVNANNEELLLPAGFMMRDLPSVESGLSSIAIAGRDGTVPDETSATIKEREIEIVGRIMDDAALRAGDIQAARAAVMTRYFEIMAFASNARRFGAVKIYRETGIEINPGAAGYDAELEILGYYLNGYFKGGNTPVVYGEGIGGAVLDMRLRFVCSRPFWQGLNKAASASGNIGNAQSVTVQFENNGTVAARPVFIITPAAAFAVDTGKVLGLTVNGVLTVTWNGSIASGKSLVFDCVSRQVYEIASLPANDEMPVWSPSLATNKAAGLVDIADWTCKEWEFANGVHGLNVTCGNTAAAGITAEVRHINEYHG